MLSSKLLDPTDRTFVVEDTQNGNKVVACTFLSLYYLSSSKSFSTEELRADHGRFSSSHSQPLDGTPRRRQFRAQG